MPSHARRHLDGPPYVLPEALDRVVEAWWRARPRSRAIGGLAAAGLLSAVAVTHLAMPAGGPPATVWVATRDLLPGEVIGTADAQRRSWPRDLVPASAVDRPTGTVTAPLPRGAVVTDRHLGDLGIAAAVPPGRVAVAVPVDQLPMLAPGTALDLIGPGADGRGERLARAATVVASDGEALWIAIDPQASLAVSAAIGSGTIAAVVHPG